MSSAGALDSLLKREGYIKTDLYCHSCSEKGLPSNFIAEINHDLEGNHAIECPRCGHKHFRVIKQGRVTSERYDSDLTTHVVERRNMWKSATVPITTGVASSFIRDRWLNRGDD